jgi:hypothetical protein
MAAQGRGEARGPGWELGRRGQRAHLPESDEVVNEELDGEDEDAVGGVLRLGPPEAVSIIRKHRYPLPLQVREHWPRRPPPSSPCLPSTATAASSCQQALHLACLSQL